MMTAMRYVHPREEAVEKLLMQLGNLERPEGRVECKRSVQNPVQSDMPSDADIAKLLSTGNLQIAEVVELADTPSARIALAILYKLLIIKLLPFDSPPYRLPPTAKTPTHLAYSCHQPTL
jgi:hypothetical protein